MPLESSLSEYTLNIVWFFPVGFVLENGFLRLRAPEPRDLSCAQSHIFLGSEAYYDFAGDREPG